MSHKLAQVFDRHMSFNYAGEAKLIGNLLLIFLLPFMSQLNQYYLQGVVHHRTMDGSVCLVYKLEKVNFIYGQNSANFLRRKMTLTSHYLKPIRIFSLIE